ncbi:MAG: EscU/YscU/HrcU family type III secretion system export apparatus switch protein [Pseudomonadota bacterium]
MTNLGKSAKQEFRENSKDQSVAVALHYDNKNAPRVTAKGKGKVAERIIETAQESDVPLQEDPILAQALSTIPLDEEIPEELYKAVAEVLGFVLRARAQNTG